MGNSANAVTAVLVGHSHYRPMHPLAGISGGSAVSGTVIAWDKWKAIEAAGLRAGAGAAG
jgi:hypothetical protein